MITIKRIVVLVATLIPTLTVADSIYRITDIGDLPGGEDYSESADLNNNGEAVWQNPTRAPAAKLSVFDSVALKRAAGTGRLDSFSLHAMSGFAT